MLMNFAILICLINIAGLFLEVSVPKDNIKFIAKFTVVMVFLLCIYAALMIAVSVKLFILHSYLKGLVCALFCVMPFVIGKLSTYKKIRFYLFLHLGIFILATLFLICV